MSSDRTAELHRWLSELRDADRPAERVIAAGARTMLDAIEVAEDTEYRAMALCKLTDAVITAAVACRQLPAARSQTAAKVG